jgi:hypothetical protein
MNEHLVLHQDGSECGVVSTDEAIALVKDKVCRKEFGSLEDLTVYALVLQPGQQCPTCSHVEH